MIFSLIVLIFGISVGPIMLAARLVGAQNTGSLSVVKALILNAFLALIVSSVLGDGTIVGLILFAATVGIFAYVLDTTIPRSFVLTLISMSITLTLAWVSYSVLAPEDLKNKVQSEMSSTSAD